MNIFSKLLYKWFNLEPDQCQNCELLKNIIEQERFERKQMLQVVIDSAKPREEAIVQTQPGEYRPKLVNWNNERLRLEREDRQRAAELMKKKQEELAASKNQGQVKVEELEKALEIKQETANGT